jgi:3-phosphoshikimate 1-carboxyvinyltransferase
MKPLVIRRSRGLKGKITLPGDKSIAHRAAILSSLARGRTSIYNFPLNKDCLATLNSLKSLGLKFQLKKTSLIIYGVGTRGLVKPRSSIIIEESGTTFRLFSGLLAGLGFKTTLKAGASLSKRPMSRVSKPLMLMGAGIRARTVKGENYPPLNFLGGRLKGIVYKLPVASAQVKSAILLAGLFAEGTTKIIEPLKTRDHTERMLKLFKADINIGINSITIRGESRLISPGVIYVPGDLSSAAFFMIGASIIPGSNILIKNVSLNPGRIGVINVLKRMAANINIRKVRVRVGQEPRGDISVRSSVLKGAEVRREEIPFLIDEVPILMVAACFARGKTVFKGVSELHVKETDRIKSMVSNLEKMGADILLVKEGGSENIIINGGQELKGASLKSFGDHRTAMSMIIAALASSGESRIDDISCISKSFPEFLSALRKLN